MVFNATFKNISAILWRSVLLVVETRIHGENNRPATRHWQTLSHNVASIAPRHERGSNQTTLVVIGTDCIGSCKSKYNTITPTTSLDLNCWWHWNEMCCNNIYHSSIMNIPIVEENDDWLNLYWTANLHKNLGRKGYFKEITVLFAFDVRKCSFTWRRIKTFWIILILVLFFFFRKVIYPNILHLYTLHLVNRYGILVSQMNTDMFRLS